MTAPAPGAIPAYKGTVETGLPALRKSWIEARNDTESYEGRAIEPRDNGYLTANHAEYAAAKREGLLSPLKAPINAQRNPLRAKGSAGVSPASDGVSPSHTSSAAGRSFKPVTQLAYARAGIITPEMEFIAIRENMGRQLRPERRIRIAELSNDNRPQRPATSSTSGSAQQTKHSALRTPGTLTRPPSSPASPSASLTKSPPSSSAPKSPQDAPSFPRTSTTPNSSR
jgi:phosphomethylpyrimidine synthase